MKYYVGVTDLDWFTFIHANQYQEVNFWRPGGRSNFRAINKGDLFLFKLHSPNNFIVGGGVFLEFATLPLSLAWDAFKQENGVETHNIFVKKIEQYSRASKDKLTDPNVGCIILSEVFYFDRENWIPVPSDWSNSIVQGKTYSTDSVTGAMLFADVQLALQSSKGYRISDGQNPGKYGSPIVTTPRLGQGAFHALTVQAYNRRCAITGEKTLPVLEAAHIVPYSQAGIHEISNGILLRRDYHTLFDRGYITIDSDYKVVVSSRIKSDFGNGREYYAHHGEHMTNLPSSFENLPSKGHLAWHNENIFLG